MGEQRAQACAVAWSRQFDDVSWCGDDAATEPQRKSALQSALWIVRTFGQNYLKRRYTILFYTLVFTIVASPVTAAFGLSGALIDSLLAVSLLAAVMPAAATEKTRSFCWQ